MPNRQRTIKTSFYAAFLNFYSNISVSAGYPDRIFPADQSTIRDGDNTDRKKMRTAS